MDLWNILAWLGLIIVCFFAILGLRVFANAFALNVRLERARRAANRATSSSDGGAMR